MRRCSLKWARSFTVIPMHFFRFGQTSAELSRHSLLSAAFAQVLRYAIASVDSGATRGSALRLCSHWRAVCRSTAPRRAPRRISSPSKISGAISPSQGIAVNTTSPVNILVTRYGSPISKSIYADATQGKANGTGSEFPAEMKAEGYAIIPDGKGLAITAASDAGIFYALQTVKQLFTGSGTNAMLHTAVIRDWPAMKYRGTG